MTPSPIAAPRGRQAPARTTTPLPAVAAGVRRLARADPDLARLIAAVGPCRLEPRPTPSTLAAVAEAIVSQQLTGRAATAIYRRLCAALPRPAAGPTAAGILALGPEGLRAAGLSGAKAAALVDLAERARRRQLPTLASLAAMDDEAVIAALTEVRGVGRWTAEMVLIFRLGRLDVLAVDDYGLRKGLGLLRRSTQPLGAAAEMLFEPATRVELAEAGEAWRPYRSVASWYLWRLAEQPSLLAPP